MSATTDDSCSETAQVSGCSRGLISVVSLATNQVQSSIDVWRRVPRGGFEFRTIIADPSGSRLYVVLLSWTGFQHSTIVRTFDTRSLSRTGEISMPSIVTQFARSPDGARLFCARPNDVAVIDTRTNVVAPIFPTTDVSALALSPSGDLLYVSQGDGLLAVYDTVSYALLRSVPLPIAALSMAVSADGGHVYAGLWDGSLVDFDANTNTIAVLPGVSLGSNLPLDVTLAKGHAYVSSSGGIGRNEGVTVVDLASLTITTRIPIVNTMEIATNVDESRVFVTHEEGLRTIDTATNSLIAFTRLPLSLGRLTLASRPPFAGVTVDTPVEGARVQQPFLFGGWAADLADPTAAPGIDTVHVWASPTSGGSPVFLGAAQYGLARPDVAALLGLTYLNAGYQMTVRGLSPGAYILTAFGHSTRTGAFSVVRQVPITIEASLPMAIDSPAAGAVVTGPVVVAGWALDTQAASGSGVDTVHVWAYPTSGGPPLFAGAASVGYPRPDVAAVYGAQFGASGYRLEVSLPPGSYSLIVYAHQISTGMFAAERAVNVTIVAPQVHMFIDLPAANTTVNGSVRVAGWAFETGQASGSGIDAVHAWAYPASGGMPILVGVASYGIARPDVGAVFGARYAASGFDVTGLLPPGGYDVVAFAHSATTHTFSGVQIVHVIMR